MNSAVPMKILNKETVSRRNSWLFKLDQVGIYNMNDFIPLLDAIESSKLFIQIFDGVGINFCSIFHFSIQMNSILGIVVLLWKPTPWNNSINFWYHTYFQRKDEESQTKFFPFWSLPIFQQFDPKWIILTTVIQHFDSSTIEIFAYYWCRSEWYLLYYILYIILCIYYTTYPLYGLQNVRPNTYHK